MVISEVLVYGPVNSPVCLFWAELAEQGLALALAEPAQPPAGGDLQPFHDLLSADLAHAWQSLEQCRDLHLAQDVVTVGLGQDLLEVGPTALEALLELDPGTSGGGRLLQRSGPLLLGQLGKGHGLLRRL